MKQPKVVVINTYAGSLLIGAALAGAEVEYVLEHNTYGKLARLYNFPNISATSERFRWDEHYKDLSDKVVITHPPCAAFSIAANSQGSVRARGAGTKSKHFDITHDVLGFALSRHPLVLLIESVVPTLEGAREVHDAYAGQFGYKLLRILQNAALYNVPQWRPRFWCAFIRTDVGPGERIPIGLNPKLRTIGHVMCEAELGEVDLAMQRMYDKQVELFRKEGLSAQQVEDIFSGGDYGFGHVQDIVKRLLGLKSQDIIPISKRYCVSGSFLSTTLRVLNPAEFAPVVMGTSYLIADGRLLTIDEYKAIAGFPRDYIFIGKEAPKFREYLSKGVAPPVAAWLLRWALDLCKGKLHTSSDYEMFFDAQPGETIEFSMKRDTAAERARHQGE